MTPQSLDTVRRLAAETLHVPDRRLAETQTLHDAGVDSLATLDLVFAVEGHFGITLAADDVAQMQSLNDLAACVDRLTTHEARRHDA
jgi:acyl carrier protein